MSSWRRCFRVVGGKKVFRYPAIQQVQSHSTTISNRIDAVEDKVMELTDHRLKKVVVQEAGASDQTLEDRFCELRNMITKVHEDVLSGRATTLMQVPSQLTMPHHGITHALQAPNQLVTQGIAHAMQAPNGVAHLHGMREYTGSVMQLRNESGSNCDNRRGEAKWRCDSRDGRKRH